MSKVVIHGFETSNNFKVRVALGFKGIDYRFETIDPSDRGEIVRISGQPFTPVMVHGETIMFDSAAILRYLEANFPDTPKLFSTDYFTMREIEKWEAFGRVTLHEPLWMMVKQRITGVSDDSETARANKLFAEATTELEAVLSNNEWLAHTRMTAADVTAVGVIRRVQDLELFDLPKGLPHMYAWAERVSAFDPGPGD